MNSFSEIIEAFGIAELAAVLETEESHVRTMKARDSIPPEYWARLIECRPPALEALDLETLGKLRAARFVSRRRAAVPFSAAAGSSAA